MKSDTEKNPPHRLKQARLLRNMTLEGVADALSTSFTTIWRYEKGQRYPSGPTLFALATLYRKPVEWFFQEEADTQYQDEDDDASFINDMDVILSEPEFMLRAMRDELSDEGIKSIVAFIQFTYQQERENRESQSLS